MIANGDISVKTACSLNSISLIFLFSVTAFSLQAMDEKTEEEQNSSRVVLFDLSKLSEPSLDQMCAGRGRGPFSGTTHSEGAIYPATPKRPSFLGEFKQSIPEKAKLWLEGTFFLSDASGPDSDSLHSIRVGFRTNKQPSSSSKSTADTSYAMTVKLFNKGKKSSDRTMDINVLSGPLADGGMMGNENEETKKQVICTGSSDVSFDASEPFHFKIMGDGESHEISVWINKQSVFKGKSAYDSVEGDLCPLDFIIGFYLRFEGQNPFGTEAPAYAKNILCYYTNP